jgi:hypothetical protein
VLDYEAITGTARAIKSDLQGGYIQEVERKCSGDGRVVERPGIKLRIRERFNRGGRRHSGPAAAG